MSKKTHSVGDMLWSVRQAILHSIKGSKKTVRQPRVSESRESKSFWSKTKARVSEMRAGKFSLKEQTLFVKRLAFLINAGVPIVEALIVLKEQTSRRGRNAVIEQVVHDVSNGQALSKSFAKFPNIFSEFAVQIIKVGETSGTLFQNLNYLADELKKRATLRRKVVGAFVYPALITLATLGITVFLMVYLFPKITPIFVSLHAELPFTTRLVMTISNALIAHGLTIFLAIFFFIVALTFTLKRSTHFHTFFDWIILKVPLVGGMLLSYNVANGCRTLGLLLKSGVRLSEAFTVTADTTTNRVYKNAYRLLAEAATRGDRASVHLAKRPDIFPDIMAHMVAVGERSGTLSDTFVYLSELYDTEVDDFTKNLSTLIEPVLMIVMGVLVGFIAISIITPIYGITQSLSSH
jgi:type IV pilus assembly protein PilC